MARGAQVTVIMTQDAFEIDGLHRPGRWVVTCDHATNIVPDWVAGGDLGLPPADMERHIAYDVGAAGVTRRLAERLDSPAVLSRFSRLVIDPNRGSRDPTMVRQIYDGSIVPGNAHISEAEIAERLDRLYRPYHDAIETAMATRETPILCAVHSFTPRLKGKPNRPWEIGILSASDDRLTRPIFDACLAEGWVTGWNEPYGGYLPGDSIDQHATLSGRLQVLIELRHDLISDAAGQTLWADRLAGVLARTLQDTGL